MDYTNNLHLPQFASSDRIHHDDFNDAFAKIDTAVKTNSTAITALDSAKASTADLTAETQARENADTAEATARTSADTALGGRIDAEATARTSADTALGGRIDSEAAARAAAVAAINANLGSHGHNLRIAAGSYEGDGRYGSSNPHSLTFDFKPMMVFISSEQESRLGSGWMIRPFTIGTPSGSAATGERIRVTWADRGVSWYTMESSNASFYQSSRSGYTYHWLALGCDDSEE